jgi:ribosomal protein S18 acetylase RimI-like enzyme
MSQTFLGAGDPPAALLEPSVLDHAVWASLTGPHAHLAEVLGRAARYLTDVSPYVALSPDLDVTAWDDLAALAGPGAVVPVAGVGTALPAGWEVVARGEGMQMVDAGVRAEEYPDAVRLQTEDVPEMLDLAIRTRPGPFLPRTIELGTYLGVRRGGALVAMAGERLHPPGWAEISGVCTDPAHRGQGLATRLIGAVAAGIRDRGDTPFLHIAGHNVDAIRLFASLGFTLRRRTTSQRVRVPVPRK